MEFGGVLEPDKTAYRPIRAIGLLLILQVIGLVALGVYEFGLIDWQLVSSDNPSRGVLEVAAFALFAPPAVLTLLSGLSFLLLRRRGWLLAAIAQGLSLAVCLWLYTLYQPGYVYPIMAYCIPMILYLNSHDVRVVFRTGRDRNDQEIGGAA
ncbi:MAG: hypothetical protein ACRDTR_16445 [Rubrobacter sp.]